MKKIKLDKYEQDIENNIQEYKSISAAEKKLATGLIKKANNNKKNISLRVNAQDLELFKRIAQHEGIPYQTLLSSVIHKFVTGQLVEEQDILKSIQLLNQKLKS